MITNPWQTLEKRVVSFVMKHAIFFATLTLSLFASRVQAQTSSFSGATMGTRYRVTVVGKISLDLQSEVDARLAVINSLMSTYDPNSELSRFNQTLGTAWFEVSPETAKVIGFALQVSKATNGIFDPTVAPAVNLWGFGPAGRRKKSPTAGEVEAVRSKIGYEQIVIRQKPSAIRKTNAEAYLDLSAVAKGYAVDEISGLLVEEGFDSHLVVIGGEIRACGTKPDGSKWKIGIEEPDHAGKPVQRSVSLVDMAVSTSGDWRNSFQDGGVRYSHVIEPRTAKPVTHKLASVTVFAKSNMEADAWSTALMVMGAEKGLQWCDEHNVPALFFVREESNSIRVLTSVAAESLEQD